MHERSDILYRFLSQLSFFVLAHAWESLLMKRKQLLKGLPFVAFLRLSMMLKRMAEYLLFHLIRVYILYDCADDLSL